jgi:hypothetical protein
VQELLGLHSRSQLTQAKVLMMPVIFTEDRVDNDDPTECCCRDALAARPRKLAGKSSDDGMHE